MDINEMIFTELSKICKTAFGELTDTQIPSEYIVYDRIYGTEQGYADNQALQNYHLYRVNVYASSKLRREQIVADVKSKMKAAGFYLRLDNIPIPREKDSGFWGAYSEFAYYEVI